MLNSILLALLAQPYAMDAGVTAPYFIAAEEIRSPIAIIPGHILPLYQGYWWLSGRPENDNSADFYFGSPNARIDAGVRPIAQFHTNGFGTYSNVATTVYSDGVLQAGMNGGRAAFMEGSGISGATALTCNPYSNPNGCYTHISSNLCNESFHGAVTLSNQCGGRDAGLVFQVMSGGKRPESYATTTMTQTIFGDVTLWGGTIQPYFSQSLPECKSGQSSLDGKSGEGAIAWLSATKKMYVCDGTEWKEVNIGGCGD